MNYPRVNLIKKNERRYQGLLSRGFILTTGIGVPSVFVLLVFVLLYGQSMSLNAQLESSRAVWENYEPRLKQYRKEKSGLTTTGKIKNLFDGWGQSQRSFLGLLEEFQQGTPANIQFTRLSIRTGASKPIYKTAEELELDYDLVISGKAEGEAAENAVIKLQKHLLSGQEVGSTFNTLKLASMRNSTTDAGTPVRQFSLTGSSKQEGEK